MDDGASNVDETQTNHASGQTEASDGTKPGLTNVLGRITTYLKQRRYKEALKECDEALCHDPENEKLLEKKIKVLCHWGHFQEAYNIASSWKQREPQHAVANKELNRLKIVLNALEDQDSEDESSFDPALPVEVSKAEVRSSPDGREETGQVNSLPAKPATNIVLTLPAQPKQKKTVETYDFVCTFCDIKFKKQEELDTHCRSDLHKKKLTSDEGHGWKFRAPPRGLNSEEYVLCQRFSDTGRCPFGDKCTQAHSEDELNEWKERFKFRKQQLQKARESQLHGNSYTEQLLERLINTESPKAVLVHNLDFVKVHVNSDLKVNMTNKKCTNAWTFTITSKICLHSVALLDDVNRSYFHVSSISVGPKKTQKYQNLENHCQEWINHDTVGKGHGEYVYRVKVVFKTDLYGTFRMSIVFDFGLEAVMTREMQVESAPVMDADKLTKDMVLTDANRWTEEKVETVPFEPKTIPLTEEEKKLLAKYTLPRPEKFSLSETYLQLLSKENYRLWMHEMLYIEEMAQLGFIARYNVKTSLQLVNRFLLMPGALSTAKFAHDGQLFGRMKLEDDLSEDSMGGRLILTSSQLAWIAPASASASDSDGKSPNPDKVYEVVIEDKGKNFIFLRLSKQCIEELKLSCDQEFEAQIQFQLNRLPKCEMHAAVDKLPTLNIVFPPVDSIPSIPWTPQRQWNDDMDSKLNVKQKEAIIGVVTDLAVHLPPLLIVGPFGTGKTFTMAQAAKQVLKQENTRLLICTHSNSAADLYIRDFFHPHVEDGNPEARPLRVYYCYRWIQTVPEVVIQYSLYQRTGDRAGTFRLPNKDDLDAHRVVITTLGTSRYISDLDLPKGFFTHIFIDEAAQALECETLIPLSLASESTRIVLAGDHMQLSPEVYSDFTRQQGFHTSLLERLYEMYPSECACKIMLCENYRSHSAIVDFTSELFYDNKLISSGKLTAHNSLYPLTFYAAKGEEIQHQNSTGFYNNAEVYEIVERLDELQKKWPDEWGPLEDNCIGVLAPYSDQVIRIRAEMRKRKMYNISVERVLNVQGKQYRVIVLSTVRTRHTCRSDTSVEDIMDYGFLSNVKLLNTAITRAQSLVIVVGEPVSLCLVGKCRKVWEYFLEICNQHGSFYGMTWSQLRSQLEGAEMTKTYVLNPLAPEFVPNRLFHFTNSASELSGSHLQGTPHIPPWQQLGAHQMAAYGPSLLQQMYQPVLPYYQMPMYPHGYYGPMMYRPLAPHRQGSPVGGRAASPKTTPSRPASQTSPTGHSHKPRSDTTNPQPETIKPAEVTPAHGPVKTMYKPSKNRMMVYWPPRMPMAYPPFYPMLPPYPGYFYMPEDHRMAMHQHSYMPHGLRFPHHGHVHPAAGGIPSDRAHMAGSATVSPNGAAQDGSKRKKVDGRASPRTTVSGQKIQLMPNVKHVPAHLFPANQKDVSVNPPVPAGPVNPSVEERRGTPVSERPYSPANYGSDRGGPSRNVVHQCPQEETDENKKEIPNANEPQSRRLTRKHLQLKTGFSRQFSDDLPTPTEITDLVRMIEESIEEKKEAEESERSASPVEINGQNRTSPVTKLQVHIDKEQHTSESPSSASPSTQNGEKLSYAGVLRKNALPLSQSSQNGQNGNSLENMTNIEPQTPRTPVGFISLGGDVEMDPFGILKSLNIESSPQHQRYPNFP